MKVAEEAETPKVLDEISKSNSATPRSLSDRQKRTAVKRFGVILIFLLPIIVVMLFLGYQQWNVNRELSFVYNENARLSAAIESADTRIEELENRPAPLPAVDLIDPAVIEQLRRDFEDNSQRLTAMIVELQTQTGVVQVADNTRWQLAEAQYLMRIANQQLQLSGNVPLAISILETADRILAGSSNSRVYTVRQTLGRELTQLRGIAVLDLEGVYIRLNTLKENIASLTLNNSPQEAYRDRLSSANQSSNIAAASEQSLFNSGLEFISSVFVWRNWDEAPDVMYPPQHGAQVKSNIILMLEQAQLALMSRQPSIYAESLGRARIWIEDTLSGMSSETALPLSELNSLMEVELQPVLPDISQSLALIRQVQANTSTTTPEPPQ
jgi:uroporphyrin-3 C-methyltransferase